MARALWRCPVCRRDFAVPVGWEPRGRTEWQVGLYCSNCSASMKVTASRDELDALHRQIDLDVFRLRSTVERLRSRRRAREIDVFVIALQRDLICADDFAR
jgi:hypothetical protein